VLLADRAHGEPAPPDTLEIYTTAPAFQAAWSKRYADQPAPRTTLEHPLFVVFNLLVDAGCPEEAVLDALRLDQSARLLYGVFSRPSSGKTNCGDIAGSHSFVVAISRDALPAGHLTIRLEHDLTVCSEPCGSELEQTELDI
jgi:hypothetical protein